MMKVIRRIRSIRVLVVIVAVFALQACAEINHLRDAQDMFNETARQDNEFRLSKSTDQLIEAQIRSGYASVVLSLNSLSAKQKSVLKEHRLYGSALVLEALSLWRLGNLTKASTISTEAEGLLDSEIDPRDHGIIAAMPGLIKNSQASASMDRASQQEKGENSLSQGDKNKAYKNVSALLDSAINDYNGVLKKIPSGHGLRVYLDEAKIIALQNKNDSLTVFNQGLGGVDIDAIRVVFSDLLTDMCAASVDYTDDVRRAKLAYWSSLTGVNNPKTQCPESVN